MITRERDDAEPLVARLREWGFDARCIPAIERAPLPWPADLEGEGLWFLTSPYAARLTLEHLGRVESQCRLEGESGGGPRAGAQRAASGLGPGQRFAAVAPATARVLEEAGVVVDVVAGGGSAGLARAVFERGLRGTVLYPTSDAGLDSPEQRTALDVLAGIGEVRRAPVYTTRPPPTLAADLRALRGAPYHVVLFSPSAVAAVERAVHDGAPPPVLAVCVGESTMRAHDALHPSPASALVPRGVDVADFLFAWPHKPEIA